MLLVHGTGASSDSFHALGPLLASRFTVFAPDLPGHSRTRVPRHFDPSLPRVAEALAGLLQELRIAPVVALGHSAGAAVVARMMLDGALEPRLFVGVGAALVPFAAAVGAVLRPMAGLLSRASPLIPSRATDHAVDRMIRTTGSVLDRDGVERYGRLMRDPRHVRATLSMMARWRLESLFASLSSLSVRALLVAGERDRAAPLWQQRAAARRFRDVELSVIERAGHLVHEEQPARVAAAIMSELDGARSCANGIASTRIH